MEGLLSSAEATVSELGNTQAIGLEITQQHGHL